MRSLNYNRQVRFTLSWQVQSALSVFTHTLTHCQEALIAHRQSLMRVRSYDEIL
jgi:hypothetical protein